MQVLSTATRSLPMLYALIAAYPGAVGTADARGRTPLHLACERPSCPVDVVAQLVMCGPPGWVCLVAGACLCELPVRLLDWEEGPKAGLVVARA
jgi:hypothetical protein